MEKQDLKLDHIRLTPELIETINSFQACGTTHWSDSPGD